MLNLFEHVHYPNFLSPNSLFDVNVKKQKDPDDEFEPYAFVQDLHWRKGQGSCFECRLFIYFSVFKRNMSEKDVCGAHRFGSLYCNFFLYGLFTLLMTSKVKKNK